MAEKTETYLVREAEEQDMGSMLSYESFDQVFVWATTQNNVDNTENIIDKKSVKLNATSFWLTLILLVKYRQK